MSRPVVVVLGMGPTGLSIVRGLGRKGVRVYGVGLSRFEVGLSSRYCTPLGAIDPRHEPERLCRRLIEFAQQHPDTTKVLYASGDECVAFISEHDAVLGDHYVYDCLTPEVANRFLSKKAFHALCLAAGVPTMQSFFPQDVDGAMALRHRVPYPCLLKPIRWHLWAEEFGLCKGLVCPDPETYAKNLKRVAHVIDNLMVQEIVEGPEDALRMVILYMDGHGQAHGLFTGRKFRQYPPDFGTGSAVVSSPEADIVEPALRLLRQAGYRGMAEVEFKWCLRDQVFKAIEVNIRPCRLGGLVEASGAYPLYASFVDLTGDPPFHQAPQRYGVKWLFMSRDTLAVASGLVHRRLRLSEVRESYRGPRVWCIWSRDDPKPFFAYFAEMTSKGFRTLVPRKRRRTLAAAPALSVPVAERARTP